MRMSRFAAVALATAFSLSSFAATAQARDSVRHHAASPAKTVQKCHVERVKVRQHGKVVTMKKKICERVAVRGHKGR
ncbi:hypothetical protein [Aureimonas glaciei]|uniref:Uncharacterized protein n=1 Tax=Aureimonas glaciei TaxID=1776957 RepID=A0A916XSI7_9HYPH|nr:hypothetical protein [Aureimonas glaciei]GGD03932.1 hypothetical protein GCM10011335_03410 [Aureimonas glaciei]